MCAFILAMCCRSYKPGQVACMRSSVLETCLYHLRDVDPLLRQWSALCLAQLWDDFDEAKGAGVASRAHELLCSILHTDDVPEVRAAVLYALGTLLGTSGATPLLGPRFGRSIACSGPAAGLTALEQTDVELGVAMSTLKCSADGSPVVRRELVVLLSAIVHEHQGQFIIAAYQSLVERASAGPTPADPAADVPATSSIATSLVAAAQSDEGPSNPIFQATMFSCMFKCLFDLMADPHSDVAALAAQVMDHIFTLLLASPLGPSARAVLVDVAAAAASGRARASLVSVAASVLDEGSDSLTLRSHRAPAVSLPGKRASVALALKSIALLGSAAGPEPLLAPPSALRLSPHGKLNSASSSRLSSLSQSPDALPSPLHQSASTDSLRYLQSRANRSTSLPAKSRNAAGPTVSKSTPPSSQTPVSVLASPVHHLDPVSVDAIMLDLVQQDDERLRRRRTMPVMTPDGRATPVGSAPVEQVLPLQSSFFNFSLEYYKESQMKVSRARVSPPLDSVACDPHALLFL